MSCCGHCQDAGNLFNEKKAKKDLRRYRKNGPAKSTELLLQMIYSSGVPVDESSLLDVGGGIGAIQLELFDKKLNHATNVDASSHYLQTSRQEAERRHLTDLTDFHFGDVVDIAPKLPKADIVTLDRVICCYPDPQKLVEATTSKATKIYGVVYPRVRVITKIGLWLGNLWSRLWDNEFRIYLFPSHYIDTLIKDRGFVCQSKEQTFLWNIALYQRKN